MFNLDYLIDFFLFKILQPPASYQPIRTPARKLTATPTPLAGGTGFRMQVCVDVNLMIFVIACLIFKCVISAEKQIAVESYAFLYLSQC